MKSYESLERVQLICDEKVKSLQGFIHHHKMDISSGDMSNVVGRVWHLFFDFQIDMLKASRDEVPANEASEKFAPGALFSKFPPKPEPDIDPMEAAAIDAGYIKDVRDNPLYFDKVNGKRACFYFYPQDISAAQEGDVWHDLDGRPHFCLGDGWIEARGFRPSIDKDHKMRVKDFEGKVAIYWSKDQQIKQPHVSRKWPNLIASFKFA